MSIRHEDHDSFCAAEHTDQIIIRDRDGLIWQAWETEDGDWYAIRPRNDDDQPHGFDDDGWRPVGPDGIESLRFPLYVASADDALRPDTEED